MPRQRNLLFVFDDQHRGCDLGCYGNPEVRSPNLDHFATGALRFQQAITNCPLCVPARGTLLTGLHAMRHRAISNDLPIRRDVTSIAHVLEEAGVHTGYVGKWHLAGVPRDKPVTQPERLGFSEWKVAECTHDYLHSYYWDEDNVHHNIEGYEPIGQTDMALDFIQRNQGHPWSLFLSWGPPHDPYQWVPQEYLDLFNPAALSLRPNVEEPIIQTRERHYGITDLRLWLQGYYAHIAALDEQFGRLMASLEATGQLEDTVVVFTSDHGDMLGSHGFENKQLPHEESARIPLLIGGPGVRAGVTNELIGLVDLPVTLLGLLGLTYPGEVDGADLSGLLTSDRAEGLRECYLYDLIPCHQAFDRGGDSWRAVRTRRHTYARTPHDEGWLLFDNLADPYQQQNLIGDPAHADLESQLSARLDEAIARHDELIPWEDLVRKYGFTDVWNESQSYFGRETL